MSELLSQLQQLGDGEIDDLSIAHDASEEIVALRLQVAELVEALTMARETIAYALRANAPDYFTTDADIARHVDIQRIDTALAAHRMEPSHDNQ